MAPNTSLLADLLPGSLDIIGDVHGEIDHLETLLDQLGYRANGVHPADRRLVFVGDLTDRGPDSPAVVRRVRELVEAERAQCVLGNHELNILRGEAKEGNRWITEQRRETYSYGESVEDANPLGPLGQGDVMCVDYAVGHRARERAEGASERQAFLAAYRWPEREVVFSECDV